MKVCVTGGCGYIGDAVVQELLEAKVDVVVVDDLIYGGAYMRPNVKFIRDDISSSSFLDTIEKEKPDTVVHLAALVGDGACQVNKKRTIEVNETATGKLAVLCGEIKTRLVFASTCSVYGANNDILNEDSPTNPLSLYAGTKLKAEKYIDSYAQDHVIFRLGTLYGLSTEHARIRGDLVANILTFLAAQDKLLTVYGGSQWRPLLHVRDAASLFVQAALGMGNGLYVAAYENMKISDLALMILQLVGKGKVEFTDRRFEDLRNYHVDSSKLTTEGFKLKRNINEGIIEMAEIMEEGRIADVWNSRFNNAKFIGEQNG